MRAAAEPQFTLFSDASDAHPRGREDNLVERFDLPGESETGRVQSRVADEGCARA